MAGGLNSSAMPVSTLYLLIPGNLNLEISLSVKLCGDLMGTPSLSSTLNFTMLPHTRTLSGKEIYRFASPKLPNQLAKASDVKITIYDARGVVIR